MQYHELRLTNIILYSRLAPDLNSAKALITNNLVFINGSVCLNQNLILLKNDFFQLVISFKYYLLAK
jgi:ribosomal protein S4